MPQKKHIPDESLLELRQRLELLPAKSPERRQLINKTAELFGVSQGSVYRGLYNQFKLKKLQRADSGTPRVISQEEMQWYCEVIAAIFLHQKLSGSLRKTGYKLPMAWLKFPKGCLKKLRLTAISNFGTMIIALFP